MPHQCVRCGHLYQDGDSIILKGCPCGAKLFFFIKPKFLEESQKAVTQLNKKEREEIEKDVFDLLGIKPEEEKPVVLDFESIEVLSPGKYHLDLVHLFKKEPLIIKLEEGKYLIDLLQAFKKKE